MAETTPRTKMIPRDPRYAVRDDEAQAPKKAVHDGDPTSNDPNDPMNRSQRHKWLTYLTICLFSFIANVNASAFTTATKQLALYFHISLNQAVQLTAFNVLAFGAGNIIWVPMMRVTGKRPVFLLALTVLLFANVWSGQADSYEGLLAARIFSGIGAAAADATVPSVVADLFRRETRGSKMMYFHIALVSGVFLGPGVNANIVYYSSKWQWCPKWIAIVTGVALAVAFVCIHETQYTKPRMIYPTDEVPEKITSTGYLSLSRGYLKKGKTNTARQALLDILIMATYPPILFASMLVGVFVGSTIIIQVSASQKLAAPPYNWKLSSIGLFNFAGWIGALLSIFVGGVLIDHLVKGAGRHAGPERRLPALLIVAVLGPPGLILFGVGLENGDSWLSAAFGYAMHSFAFVAASNIIVTYAVDCYKEVAGEAMLILFVIRNLVACLVSMFCAAWIAQIGLRDVFVIMAGVEWAIVILGGLPMYYFSKRLLAWTAGFGPQKRTLAEQRAEQRRREEVEIENELMTQRHMFREGPPARAHNEQRGGLW